MTDTTAGEGVTLLPCPFCGGNGASMSNGSWQTSCTECHAGTPMRYAERELAEAAWNRRVTLAAQPSAGAQGGVVRDWQPMRTAPKDGTEIETLCVHPTAHYSKDAFGEGWAAVVKVKWIDHNDGGWTWSGLCGVHMAWRPLATPAQPDTGDVAALRDRNVVHINILRGGIAKLTPTHIGHLYRGEEAAEVVREVIRQNPDAALSKPNAQGREG